MQTHSPDVYISIGLVRSKQPAGQGLTWRNSVTQAEFFNFRNVIPDNLFEATFTQTQTQYIMKNITVQGSEQTIKKVTKTLGKGGGANILGISILECFFSAAFICILVSKYSRTSMARTPLGPWKYVRDRGSSSQ